MAIEPADAQRGVRVRVLRPRRIEFESRRQLQRELSGSPSLFRYKPTKIRRTGRWLSVANSPHLDLPRLRLKLDCAVKPGTDKRATGNVGKMDLSRSFVWFRIRTSGYSPGSSIRGAGRALGFVPTGSCCMPNNYSEIALEIPFAWARCETAVGLAHDHVSRSGRHR